MSRYREVNVSQRIGLVAGVLVAAGLLLLCDLKPGQPQVTRTAAVALLMAVWWITEAVPIPITALLPVALFPLLGVMNGSEAASLYFNHIIFLFIGGFIVALAMEKWNLHRRIALRIMLAVGTGPRRILLGFMFATAFLSMWISNTATTMMMIPMALAIVLKFKETAGQDRVKKYAVGLLIGVAYGASIGGIATLIGTPPNLAFARIYAISFPSGPEISFARWITFALPFALVFLLTAWLVLCGMFVRRRDAPTADHVLFREEYRRLGPMRYEEGVVLVLFVVLALLWLFRGDIDLGSVVIPGWTSFLPEPGFVKDGTIAIAVALLLFVIPSRSGERRPLMGWRDAVKLNWGIVILFGGGFALAGGFENSGLSEWLGDRLAGLRGVSPLIILAVTCMMLTFLTELTSNTATAQMILPILASMAVAIGVNPLFLMIPATLSASCAFMLPVATPPNAIAFGTGEVRMQDMMRSGIVLNLMGVMAITLFMYVLGRAVFDINLDQFPDWAVP